MAKEPVSINEQEFIKAALKGTQIRIDGRSPNDMRAVKIVFGNQGGQAQVQIGPTRVLATVTADIVQPYMDRPVEGFLNFFIDFSPMASPAWEEGRPSNKCVEIGRLVERAIRDSQTLDVEALCILAGHKVWSIRCDLHVLNHDGNLTDACNLAAVAALTHFRRPDVTVVGETVTVHAVSARQPVGLDLHHRPLSITFACFNDGADLVLDPSIKEEAVCEGTLTFTINQHLELCCLQKPGGCPISMSQLLACSQLARVQAKKLQEKLSKALEAEEERADRKIYQSYKKGKDPTGDQGEEKQEESTETTQAELSSFPKSSATSLTAFSSTSSSPSTKLSAASASPSSPGSPSELGNRTSTSTSPPASASALSLHSPAGSSESSDLSSVDNESNKPGKTRPASGSKKKKKKKAAAS